MAEGGSNGREDERKNHPLAFKGKFNEKDKELLTPKLVRNNCTSHLFLH